MKWVPGVFPGGKGGRCIGLTTLPSSCADCLEKSGSLNLLESSGSVKACNGIGLHFTSQPRYTCVSCTRVAPTAKQRKEVNSRKSLLISTSWCTKLSSFAYKWRPWNWNNERREEIKTTKALFCQKLRDKFKATERNYCIIHLFVFRREIEQ
jgi:hypothetical protein